MVLLRKSAFQFVGKILIRRNFCIKGSWPVHSHLQLSFSHQSVNNWQTTCFFTSFTDKIGLVLRINHERLPFVWKNRLFQWENKWNGSFQRKFSGKKVIPSKVLLFSRFDRFNRNFLYHLFVLQVPGSSARARNIASPSNGSVIRGLFVLFFVHLARRLPCIQLWNHR